MTDNFSGKEKREFLRYGYNKPLTYNILASQENRELISKIATAVTHNLSAAGILFTANVDKTPAISSLLAMDLDFRTANVCQEIEDRALILNDKLIGRVVRIEDNEDGTCGIGVAFVTKSEEIDKDIENLVK